MFNGRRKILIHPWYQVEYEETFDSRQIVYNQSEETREVNKRIFFGLCFILFGFGNIVADFHV